MSEHSNRPGPVRPRTERWLIAMGSAFIPMLVALVVPELIRLPLVVASGAIFLVAPGP